MVVALQAKKAKTLYWSSTASHVGELILMATGEGICWTGMPGYSIDEGLHWARHRMAVERVVEGEEVAALRQGMDQLRRYLAGERVQFACPLDLYGTPFQLEVWHELYRIPYGETRTYTDIAKAIGRPLAVRAVGAANGANPVGVIVPCHRVIGSNGSLTGYGGGLPMKEWLLALEKRGREQASQTACSAVGRTSTR